MRDLSVLGQGNNSSAAKQNQSLVECNATHNSNSRQVTDNACHSYLRLDDHLARNMIVIKKATNSEAFAAAMTGSTSDLPGALNS